MSVDTLGCDAGLQLLDATNDVDVEQALEEVLHARRRHHRVGASLAVLAVVVAVVIGFAWVTDFGRSTEPPQPLDVPHSQRVGTQLTVPATLTVPAGWGVSRDAAYVELVPADGAGARIVVVSPRKVYNPPKYDAVPLTEDLALWAITHPTVAEADRWSVDGPDFAWAGTTMKLTLSAGVVDRREIPLVQLPETNPSKALTISFDERTYLWTVVYLKGDAPLLVVGISPTRDDPNVKTALEGVLDSLKLNRSKRDKE